MRLASLRIPLVLLSTLSLATRLPAQEQALVRLSEQEASIPGEVLQAVRTAQRVDIFTIGTEVLDRPVIVADKVLFNEGAVAVIENMDVPRVIIMADEFLFADAEAGVQIMRDLSARAEAPRKPPTPATPGQAGRDGRDGNRGRDGTPGTMGTTAATPRVPDIWLISNRLAVQGTSSPTATKVRFRIHVPGIRGARGGEGGDGGAGQQGGQGQNGSSGPVACRRGPGNGGDGGRGGSGGRGGNGGRGGDGGNVFYVGPSDVIDVLQFASVFNPPAEPGAGGAAGAAGNPGRGGPRGSAPGFCSAGGRSAGRTGPAANPTNLGPGNAGEPGNKGRVTAYIVNNVIDLITSAATPGEPVIP
jgi:hypothetical protein